MRKAGSIGVVVAPVYVNGTAVVREMSRKGAYVVAVDSNPSAPGMRSRRAAERVVLPSPGEAPGAFSDWLLERRDLYGGLVIPTDDFYLRELCVNRERLKGAFILCAPEGEALRVALSKELSALAARDADVAAPRWAVVEGLEDVEAALDEVPLPAIVKPDFSIAFHREFRTKVFVATNREEAREAAARALGAGHRIILQEIVPGPDESVVVCLSYWDRSGECRGMLVFRKTLQYPPVFGTGALVETAALPEVEDACKRLLRHIGYRGAACAVEFKHDARDGRWKLIDINPRTPMQTALARRAGCDVLEMLWRDKLGRGPVPEAAARVGVRWAYLKHGVLRHRGFPEHRQGWRRYLALYRPPFVEGLFSVSDPLPFLSDLLPMLRRRLTRPEA